MKSYLVPISELSEVKQNREQELNRKHCATYHKKRKLAAAANEQSFENSTASASDDNGVSSTTNNDNGQLSIKMTFDTPSQM